ncbi:unnamed protein product, partial [Chrysoparadoxa australica]
SLECYDEPGPYNSAPWMIPSAGPIDFEFYDEGGAGLAYYDSNPANQAGAQIRGDTGVDIATCGQCSGGHAVEWISTQDWLQFTVQIMYSGLYTFEVDLAAAGGADKQKGVYFMLDQPCNEAEAVAVVEEAGGTGGWGSYVTIRQAGIDLPSGAHFLRVCFKYGSVNFDSFSVIAEFPPPPPPTPAPTGLGICGDGECASDENCLGCPDDCECPGFSYAGCFVDQPGARDFEFRAYISDLNEPALCAATCEAEGFSSFGLQYGIECFCGNSFGTYGLAGSDDECS